MRGFRLIDNIAPTAQPPRHLSHTHDPKFPTSARRHHRHAESQPYRPYSMEQYHQHRSRPLPGPLNRFLRSAGPADQMPATGLIRSAA